jgi:hypothetical protein
MRVFITAILILALVLGGIFWYNAALDQQAAQIEEKTNVIWQAVYSGNIEEVSSSINELDGMWTPFQNWLMAFLDHKDISDLSAYIGKMRAQAEFGNLEEVASELSAFCRLFHLCLENSRPYLRNIL